ncbi:hypothetical protein BDV33DRAFT_199615 [Aspergillus novoparasiticus]|uniref:Uncharacterized protein n=1 Tax=Aspergillus novoparasiticus TaxID=986946 RepID=A0A5N6F3T4_9EURO|nr:hypothetical protein BDV33DRAFT_199615 [Aspergillus novoparasiticus]
METHHYHVAPPPLTLSVQDPRVEFIALDFSKLVDVLAQDMSPLCMEVTHADFSSYVHKDSLAELNVANRSLFENFLETGGKYYNVHLQPVPTPAREDQPRLVTSDENFYYHQEVFLREKQRGTTWSWNVI